MANILADGVRYVEHIKAFNDLAEDRLGSIDLTPLLIYMIDTVPASALPYLAEQFDVLGIKGWKYVSTEAEQRALIKKAIELHKYKGTPWSIKEAIKSVGVNECTIIEGGITIIHDSSYYYDSSITYDYTGWAVFRVLIDFDSFANANIGPLTELRDLILEYKNERSHLIDISFKVTDEDNLPIDEDGYMLGLHAYSPIGGIYYDSCAIYDGTYLHNNDMDSDFTVNIITVPPF